MKSRPPRKIEAPAPRLTLWVPLLIAGTVSLLFQPLALLVQR